MTATKIHQQLVHLVYLMARNYFHFPKSGVIDYLKDKGIRNQSDLRKMTEDELITLANTLTHIFIGYLSEHKTPKTQEHYDKYYKPFLDFLRKTYPDSVWV